MSGHEMLDQDFSDDGEAALSENQRRKVGLPMEV